MAGFLGTIAGRIRIDVKQAVASYAAVRAANAQTLYALRGSSTAFIGAGKGMLIAGGLFALAFGKAVSAAAEFERKLDFFGAVTDSTGAQMEAVSKKALQLGQDTIYSADEIASAFVELGKAGITAEQILGGVGDAVAHLGASADIPLVEASDIITAAVQTFNLKATDAVHVADLLQGAANASIVDVTDLGVSLKYVGGIAAATSVPIESVIDALSLLGKAGIKGSTAGTSLRQIMVSLTATSKKATTQLQELGIITKNGTNLFYTKTGSIKPLNQVFQILQNHTKDMGEAERLAAFKIIFNNRALAAANILTKKGAAGFKSMNKEISKTTAAEVSAKRLDNLSGDIEILRGNIETFLITAGTPFQNFMRTIVQGITRVVQVFGNLPQGVQTAIFAFIGIAAAALLFAGTVSLIIGVGIRFVAAIKALGFAFTFIRGAIQAVIIGMRLLGLAFLTNPIGIIITAIGLLIVGFILLYQHSETFRNIIANIGKFFVAVWNGVLSFFKDVPGFFKNLWENIKKAFTAGLDWIKENWQKLLIIFGGPLVWAVALVIKFKDQIISFFQNLGSNVVSIVGNMAGNIHDFFKELPGRILSALGNLASRFIGFFIEMHLKAVELVRTMIVNILNFFKELPGKILFLLGFLLGRYIAFWVGFYSKAIEFAKSLVEGVVSFFQELPGRILAFVLTMKDRVIQLFAELWLRAVDLARNIINGVINFFRTLPGKAIALFRNMKDGAVRLLINLWNNAKTWAGKIKDSFINTIRNLPGLVAGVFRNILSTIGGFVSDLWAKAQDAGSALWEGFKSGLGIASPSYLEKAVFQINKTLDTEVPKMKRSAEKINGVSKDIGKNGPGKGMCDSAKMAAECIAKKKSSASSSGAGSRADNAARATSSGSSGDGWGGWSRPQRITVGQQAEALRLAAMAAAAVKPPHGAISAEDRIKIVVNNPVPEPASESITRVTARITHLGLLGG